MRAVRRADGNIAVRGAHREEIFADIHAGVGWPGEQPGAIIVVGRRLDGRYHILEEKRGAMFELADAAMELSSRLVIDTFWADSSDRIASGFFKSAFWSGCKSSALIDQPIIRNAPDKLLRHFRSALEQVRGLILNESALINERLCPTLMYALRQDFEFALASPVIAAMVFGLMPLVDEGAGASMTAVAGKRWYGNRWRG